MPTTSCTANSLAVIGDSFTKDVAEIREQRYIVILDAKNQWLLDAKKKLIDDIKLELSNAKTHMAKNLPVYRLPEWIVNAGAPLILATKIFPLEIRDGVHYCKKEMEALCQSLGIKAEIELDYDRNGFRQPQSMIIRIRWPENPPSEDDLNRRKARDLDFAKEFYSKSRMC